MVRELKTADMKIVLQKIQYFCSFQERCIRDTEEKLKDWAVQKKLIPAIISELKKEDYIDEERFAKVYAGGKFRVNKWGRKKIEFELKMRHIPDDLIRRGMEEIDEDEYQKVLMDLIRKKQKEIKQDNNPIIREKIIAFVYDKGYEIEKIVNALNELNI